MPPQKDQEIREKLFLEFELNEMRDDPKGHEDLAEEYDCSTGLVGKVKKEWRERDEQAEEFFEEDPKEVLMDYLEDMSGVGDKKLDMVRKEVQRNPDIVNHPRDLYEFLKKGVKVKDYWVERIVNAVIQHAQPDEGGPSFLGPFGGQGQGGGPAFFGQGGGAGGMIPPMMMGGKDSGDMGQALMWMQMQQRERERDFKEEIKEVRRDQENLADALKESLDQQQRRFEGQLAEVVEELKNQEPEPEGPYREEQVPLTDADGNIVRDADGNPRMKWVREPVHAAQDQQQDPLEFLIKLKEAGILSQDEGSRELEILLKQMETLREDLEGSDDAMDQQVLQLMQEQQSQMADLRAQLARQEGLREASEHYGQEVQEREREIRRKEVQLAQQNADMPPDAQILAKGLDLTEDMAERFLDNVDQRQARLIQAAALLGGQGQPGESAPLTEQQVEEVLQGAQPGETRDPAQQNPPGGGPPAAPPPPAATTGNEPTHEEVESPWVAPEPTPDEPDEEPQPPTEDTEPEDTPTEGDEPDDDAPTPPSDEDDDTPPEDEDTESEGNNEDAGNDSED